LWVNFSPQAGEGRQAGSDLLVYPQPMHKLTKHRRTT
jgi:hypothetical protein